MGFPTDSGTDPLLLLVKEIEHLQAQIQQLEVCLKEARVTAADENARLEEGYKVRLTRLQANLTNALEGAAAEKAKLRARIRELESATPLTDRDADHTRQPSAAGTDRGPVEEATMGTHDDHKPTTDAVNELQDTAAARSTLEQSLQREIERLLHERDEKNRILQDRNDELVRVKAELDSLHERLGRLESSAAEAQTGRASDSERVQAEFQAHVAFLQAELSQKQWALEERQAAARALEQKHRQEIDLLRRKVAERERVADGDGGHKGDHEIVDEAGFKRSEPGVPPRPCDSGDDRQKSAHLSERPRRWRSSVGWKRRWYA